MAFNFGPPAKSTPSPSTPNPNTTSLFGNASGTANPSASQASPSTPFGTTGTPNRTGGSLFATSTPAPSAAPSSSLGGFASTPTPTTAQLTNTISNLAMTGGSNPTTNSGTGNRSNLFSSASTGTSTGASTQVTLSGLFGGGQPVNNGTRAYPPFSSMVSPATGWGYNTDTFESLEAITFNPLFSKFSLEELRGADYAQGVKPGFAGSVTWFNLNLLKGPAMEIVVGPDQETKSSEDLRQQETWCLPKSLISSYSPFLKAACSHEFEKEQNRITLTEEDPKVFALFVEWIYYNKYTHQTIFGQPFQGMDAKAWVLGDKLMSAAFKNYAMKRIYERHLSMSLNVPIDTSDFSYVCDNTTEGSKLRKFYLEFVATHFSNSNRVSGTTEAWDTLLMDYDDARMFLMKSLRTGGMRNYVHEREMYLEKDSVLLLK